MRSLHQKLKLHLLKIFMRYQQAKTWGQLMVGMTDSRPGYLPENIITPYMHVLIFHVPTKKKFSGQGNVAKFHLYLLWQKCLFI